MSRALVIASQTGGLTGCHNDADLVEALLRSRGFEVRSIREAQASRAGILGAFEELIDATGPGDAVVVSYSGHGSRAMSGGAGTPGELRFILPTDIDPLDTADFRGILTEELSALQWRLTMRTANVTTILDCCYAGRMSRGPDEVTARGWEADWAAGAVTRRWTAAREEFRRLREAHPEAGWFDANPDAVRLVACSPHQRAFEHYSTEFGRRHGYFTAALVPILRAYPRITWQAAGERARHRVLAQLPIQRPEAEGPTDRVAFTLDLRRTGPAYPVRSDPGTGQAWLDGARIHGIGPGDEFLLAGIGAVPDEATARPARVAYLAGGAAMLTAADGVPIPDGITAHTVRGAGGEQWIRVSATDGSPTAPVLAGLADIPRVRARTGDPAGEIATVTVTGGRFMLHDAAGQPLYHAPRTVEPTNTTHLRQHVAELATALRLRDLEPGIGDLAAPVDFAVSTNTGRLADGAVLHLADPVRLAVMSLSDAPGFVYANVLDLGVAGRIAVLNEAEPAGIELRPGQRRALGEQPGGHDPGLPLFWPAGVPASTPRFESFVAVFSDTPQDLRVLTQDGIVERGRSAPSLAQELARLLSTGLREVRPMSRPQQTTRWTIRRVTFLLCPGGTTCTHQL
jgi:hypothetical protein